jgi:plasmid stabilization system protein ParE
MGATEPQFHPEAQAEYSAAVRWYEEHSPRAAIRFEKEVERVLDLIVAGPDIFPKYDAENRFAIVNRFPYSVVYQVHERAVYVVAVAHASRLPDYWRDRAN